MERLLKLLRPSPPTEQACAPGAGVEIRVSQRARRISMRVDVAKRKIVLVRPHRCSDRLVSQFIADKQGWISKHLEQLPASLLLSDGSTVSIFGATCVLRTTESKSGVYRDGDVVFVSGRPDHFARRVKDWLRSEAQRELSRWAREFAAQLNVRVARVSVRDTKSRWGSCTRDGRISLSWRLIFAPREVAAYVVAHEVAHLRHMNHSPQFWKTVSLLVDDVSSHRRWLRHSGAGLYQYQ